MPIFILTVRSIRANWSLFTLILIVGLGSVLILVLTSILFLSNKNNGIIFNLKLIAWIFSLLIWLKVPSIPFNFWLPEAHVESNWSGSVILACIILKFSTFGIFVGLCSSISIAGLFGLHIAASLSFFISIFNLISTFDAKKVGALLSIIHMNFNNFIILNYSADFNIFILSLWISHSILAHFTFYSIGIFYSKKGFRISSTFSLHNPIAFLFIFSLIFLNIGIPLGFNLTVEGGGLVGVLITKLNTIIFIFIILNSVILISLFLILIRKHSNNITLILHFKKL